MGRRVIAVLIISILSLLTPDLFSTNAFAGKKLYDDFSSVYMDDNKWIMQEYVSEVAGGEYISKLRNSLYNAEVLPGIFRNNLRFQNPDTINKIVCEITLVVTKLDSASNSKSFSKISNLPDTILMHDC